MTDQLAIIDLDPQPAFAIDELIPIDSPKTNEGFAAEFAEVRTFVARHRLVAGHPFVWYLEEEVLSFRYLIGYLVSDGRASVESVSGDGRVQPVTLPGGPAATIVHTGPPTTIGDTYRRLDLWLVEQSRSFAGTPWEVFLVDGSTEPDPAAWRTRIVQPLA